MCWSDDAAAARKTVHQIWPNGAVKGQLSQDLPTWTHFEEAAGMVTEEDATVSVPCGPDTAGVVESVRAYTEAGYDHTRSAPTRTRSSGPGRPRSARR